MSLLRQLSNFHSVISRPIVDMLISTLFFVLMNICVKLLPGLPVHEMVFFRALGMALICGVLLRYQHISAWGKHKKYLLLRGIYGTFGVLFYFYTLKNIPLASAVTLQFLAPIFSSIFAIYILKEIPALRQWWYFGLSFIGVIMIRGFDSRITFFFLAIGVISPVFSGLAYNYVRKLKDYDHVLVTLFYFPVVTLCLVGPYTFFNWITPTGYEWLYLILIGIFTHCAQYFMTCAFQSEELAYVVNFNYLGVIYALLSGYFLFGEEIEPLGLFGMVLIIIALILSTRFRSLQKSSSKIQQKPALESESG